MSSPREGTVSSHEEDISQVEADVNELRGRKKSLPKTLVFGRTTCTAADIAELVRWECFGKGLARLPGDEVTPAPLENEAVVFKEHFTAGLRLPCRDLLSEVMEKYGAQLYHLTPNSIAQVSKFIWAVKSFTSHSPNPEVFAKYYELHYQPRTVIIDGEEFEGQFGCCTFTARKRCEVRLSPAQNNKWADNWYNCWFYLQVPGVIVEGEQKVSSYPLASLMKVGRPHCIVDSKVPRTSACDAAFRTACRFFSARDLVEEYVAAGVHPLQSKWKFSGYSKKVISGTNEMMPCPDFCLEKPSGKSDDDFVREVEEASEWIIGKYTKKEFDFCSKHPVLIVRRNRVFDEMKVQYPPRGEPAMPARRGRGMVRAEVTEDSEVQRRSRGRGRRSRSRSRGRASSIDRCSEAGATEVDRHESTTSRAPVAIGARGRRPTRGVGGGRPGYRRPAPRPKTVEIAGQVMPKIFYSDWFHTLSPDIDEFGIYQHGTNEETSAALVTPLRAVPMEDEGMDLVASALDDEELIVAPTPAVDDLEQNPRMAGEDEDVHVDVDSPPLPNVRLSPLEGLIL